uniref:uncharacterized protein LOC118554840 isoform X2 n=1 Tax=Halichoerus grypus TaxID=9711 RepID=UPI001659D017|nr:uncharacterized protein LOC118554840 isoform X2 [Halichoerus grypus]
MKEPTVPPPLVPTVFWSGSVLGDELDNLLTLVSGIPREETKEGHRGQSIFIFAHLIPGRADRISSQALADPRLLPAFVEDSVVEVQVLHTQERRGTGRGRWSTAPPSQPPCSLRECEIPSQGAESRLFQAALPTAALVRDGICLAHAPPVTPLATGSCVRLAKAQASGEALTTGLSPSSQLQGNSLPVSC